MVLEKNRWYIVGYNFDSYIMKSSEIIDSTEKNFNSSCYYKINRNNYFDTPGNDNKEYTGCNCQSHSIVRLATYEEMIKYLPSKHHTKTHELWN